MKPRELAQNVYAMGAVDWDRRLFDSLIPLPDGTSYNSYLIRGAQKSVLLDTVDPSQVHVLQQQLANVERIDYVVAHHAEQDHSGSLPDVLAWYPQAQVLATPKCKALLIDHLLVPAERITEVADGQTFDLGGKTLRFFHMPWVHWPETMVSYLEQDRILFTCDFFGSHLATNELYAQDPSLVAEAAKRYYAEIMMPFRTPIQGHLRKIANLQVSIIAPSHGPAYNQPQWILDAYRDWSSDKPKNEAVVAYVSMHGSTRRMVEHLVSTLTQHKIHVLQFDLTGVDLGKLAMALVDAATLIVGTPTVLVGPHPAAAYAAFLANALRPKLRFASVIGTYGWAGKAVERLGTLLPDLKAELIPGVMCKGFPREKDFAALDALAAEIAQRHATL